MEYLSSVSFDALPFPIPPDLLRSTLVSPTFVETVKMAEQFMVVKEYRTAAALYTAALQCLGVPASPESVASILCKRAECLLRLNYVQHALRDCDVSKNLVGAENEYMAFLWLRALELQGEVQEAFLHAVIYKALDPQMKRDKDAVRRLRAKVKTLFGQGDHQIDRTIDLLMTRGEALFKNNETDLALSIFTEVENLVPAGQGIPEVHEYRAQCFFIRGDLTQADHDCNRALNLSDRTSASAFDTKIKIQIQQGKFEDALELLNEWQLNEPENLDLIDIEIRIRRKMDEAQANMKMSRTESLSDVSLGHEPGQTDELACKQTVKRPAIPASKRSSGAKPKSKKELQREEWLREQERREIGQTLATRGRQKEDENIEKADENDFQIKEEEHRVTDVNEDLSGCSLPKRSKKKKRTRRKTKTLRARREGQDDDSDTNSICSTRTCPPELDVTKGTMHPAKMPSFNLPRSPSLSEESKRGQERPLPKVQPPPLVPTYSQTSKPVASVKPFTETVKKTAGRYTNKQSYGIRDRPPLSFGVYRLCKYYRLQQPCFQGQRCSYAHSEEERKAWEEDRKKGASKPTVKNDKASEGPSLSLSKWRQAFRGPCRAPLRIPPNGGKYRICLDWKKGMCKLGRGCTFAHGEKELTAWNEHLKTMENEMKRMEKEKSTEEEKKKEKTIDRDSPVKSKIRSLIKSDRPVPTYKFEDLLPRLPGVSVTCEPEDRNVSLQVPLDSEGVKTYGWILRLCYESNITGHLQDVALLFQHPKCYTLTKIKYKCTVESPHGPFTVPHSEELADEQHYPVASHLRALHGSCEVEIVVSFSTLVFGSFRQFVVFDFGKESHLALEMNIEIGSQDFLQEFREEKAKLDLKGPLWDDGSRKIISFGPKPPSVFNNEYLTAKYRLPRPDDIVPSPILDGSQGLSKENYLDVMHQLLFVEEFYIRKKVASFNVLGVNLYAAKLVVKKDEVLCAQEGWLYGSFHVTRPITPDDADGRLLLRNIFSSMGSVLIAKSQSSNALVYEALVDSVEDNRVILKLSARCCEDLALTNNSDVSVDVQFRINRLPLCEMHDNIARLGPEHIRILFPAPSNVGLEEKFNNLPWIVDQNLNEDQKEIIKKIAAPLINAPPLVVFGPFGTGKTHTLNQAVRCIALDCNNRVLICTHSNSAADIHVELLDKYLKEQHGIAACRPLRIYSPLRKLSTVSDQVKEYCLITDKGKPTEAFRLPTREEVLKHRVVVSTLGMSRALFDMDLHRGVFSHILIDEAAQALESEALTPITLAGNNTKVVFTGDHMQMSPDVFSPEAKKWGFQMSLQERLFYNYRRRQKDAKLDPNVVLLTANYRSNEQVLQFSSDMFYGGKLSSGCKQPLHPWLGPLVFYSALGKEEIEENRSSYRNLAEVNEVVKRVKELVDSWPEDDWGPKDLKQVAVVSSYRYQVKTIRDGLRKIGLGAVDVETIDNVQGKQFRALFVSTVRTAHTYLDHCNGEACESERPYLYFLSDPKLLNTAFTRAQSLFAVVGDPFSLRTIGDCQGLWEELIKRCSDNGNLFGIGHNELEESISQRGLNVNASEFVPRLSTDTSNSPEDQAPDYPASVVAKTANTASPSLHPRSETDHKSEDDTFLPRELVLPNDNDHLNVFFYENDDLDLDQIFRETSDEEESEDGSVSSSDDAGDELSESDDNGNANDFAEYGNVDETVPPKDMDDIILALKSKCEENENKRKLRDEAKLQQKKEEMQLAFVPDKETKNINNGRVSGTFDPNSTGNKVVHGDYTMRTRRGKTEIFLVNMTIKYSERTERLIAQPKSRDQICLQPEYLDRLLRENPELYRQCTLRISYDRSRTLYGEIQDVESEDISIEGSTRQRFDRDIVVVKLRMEPSSESTALQGTSERMKGKIIGTRHHMINNRERQFVCKISRKNPRVMCPINKSMTPIVNLGDKSCKGIPIYKKINPGSEEKAIFVKTLPLREALSGKFLFVVQYLHWRGDCSLPIGIVTKKIPRGGDLADAFKLLDAEYNLRKSFPRKVSEEVKRHISNWSVLPDCEREVRQRVPNAFTIDPPRSKALDDALTVEALDGDLYKVGVHIADVSYFVSKGSTIDVEAQRRGTSYFRGHRSGDVLMLPKVLSHDICSLLPNRERLAVSVSFHVNEDGRVQDENLNFRRTIVKSQCRLTYAEAQQIILGKPIPNKLAIDGEVTLEIKQSVCTLSMLAQKMREVRLSEGSFFHFDHADRKVDLEAHELVEEMMILANASVARYLVQRKEALSPLRIQLPPKTRRLNEWREKFGDSAMLSLSLRRHVPQDVEYAENISVPKSTWNDISHSRHVGNSKELNHLLCNDNIFPQLAVARSFLNGLQRRAEDVIATDVPKDHRRHWSLNVLEYTRFTSPIRRYLDIEVHRLLLDTSGQDTGAEDLSDIYRRCSFLSERSSKFEKDCARAKFAAVLKETACETAAVVEIIARDFIQLQLLSDANQYLPSKLRRIKISHLGPIEQPVLNECSGSLELTWKLRVYDASVENMNRAKWCKSQKRRERHLRQETSKIKALFPTYVSGFGYHIPSKLWLKVLNAVKGGHDKRREQYLMEVDALIAVQEIERAEAKAAAEAAAAQDVDEEEYDDDDEEEDEEEEEEEEDDDDDDDENQVDEDSEVNEGETDAEKSTSHFLENSLKFKVSDSVSVQLSANDSGGELMSPDLQLFKLAPGMDICLEHRKFPDTCFAAFVSEKSSQPTYTSIGSYVRVWKPVLSMEAATVTVLDDDSLILLNLEVKWEENNGKIFGESQLDDNFCKTRQITISEGDFACVRVNCPAYLPTSLPSNSEVFLTNKVSGVKIEDNVSEEEEETSSESDGESEYVTASEGEDNMEFLNSERKAAKSQLWVGHCFVSYLGSRLMFQLFHYSVNIPQCLLNGESCWNCTVEIIKQPIPQRRMMTTLTRLPKEGLAHGICVGKASRFDDLRIRLPDNNLSIADHVYDCGLKRLNKHQLIAVKNSLRGRFTLIQGPPGTGKTITGVHIAYWFAEINRRETPRRRKTPDEEFPDDAAPQVLYCGPSNKSVDVVAEYLMKIKGIKVLRVYGKAIEQEEFPIPNEVKATRPFASQGELRVPENLRGITLHHVIRDAQTSKFAKRLKKYDRHFARMKRKKKIVKETKIKKYRQVIKKAEMWAIGDNVDIVLCTCSAAGRGRILQACSNVKQCIVDECGMCTEPETLIPIVSSKAPQVVLIGDHKQLQPIVKNKVAKSLGLSTSMFERYSSRALMLKEQYRMHPAICEFPSQQFYNGELVTSKIVTDSHRTSKRTREFINFWPSHGDTDYVPLVFCNVVGEEEELVVTTEEGNQRSKSNQKEKDKVVEVVKKLVNSGVWMDQIAVLSPYRAQCHLIREDLTSLEFSEIPVISVVKSQGSECDFVIISLVRSLPDSEIDYEPSGAWLGENLGFVTDEHQINVALTRAKRGLCIIGNKNLLGVCKMWKCLIEHYRRKDCLVDGENWP